MHQFADVQSVFKTVAMLTCETHTLVDHVKLIPLIIFEITPVQHPEVKVYVELEGGSRESFLNSLIHY